MVLIKRLIGQGVTDVNGECSVSYVGEGTGVLNIKCEAPERMISSEIYVIDAIFKDDGVSTTNPDWYNRTQFDITVENDGTTFKNKTETTQYILANKPSTQGNTWASTFDWDNNYACAFEIISTDGGCAYLDETGTRKSVSTIGKYNFEITSSTPIQQGFRLDAGKSLKFKNFVIYPI